MQDTYWFPELTKKRRAIYAALKETELIEFIISHIVDTYRESAHFLFELLQNADDVLATKARLELTPEGIWFGHNGTIPFSLSDPNVERQTGVIAGHINAITTFSLSSKREDIENKIGKFGIGFKSVFQYTNAPHIYNPPFNFKIVDYMVPEEIVANPSAFRAGETTLTWLPFDKIEQKKEEVYFEISEKLSKMDNPLLFLRTLENVAIINNGQTREFTRKKDKIKNSVVSDVEVFKIRLNQDVLLSLDRKVPIVDQKGISHTLPINLAFVIGKNDKVTATNDFEHFFKYAWCYFPTRQNTGLSYIINAPFILTPNREALREKRTENNQIVNELARLMESSVEILKSLGYLTEEFLATIPVENVVSPEFLPIHNKLITKIKNGEYLPTKDGFITAANAYVCLDKSLASLLEYDNNYMLKKVTSKPTAKIFMNERGAVWSNSNQYNYFISTFIQEKSELNPLWFGSKFSTSMLNDSSPALNLLFFKLLSDRASSILMKNQPLWNKAFIPIINHVGITEYVKPNNLKGEPQVKMGGPRIKGRLVAADYLLADSEVNTFMRNVLNFQFPDEFDDFILELSIYDEEDHGLTIEKVSSHLSTIRTMLSELSITKKTILVEKLKNIAFVPVENSEELELANPFKNYVWFPKEELFQYFGEHAEDYNWLRLDGLELGINDEIQIESFLKEIGVEFELNVNGNSTIVGVDSFLENVTLKSSVFLSKIVVRMLDVDWSIKVPLLRETKWLFDYDGVKKLANEIKVGALHEDYPENFKIIHLALGGIVEQEKDRFAELFEEERKLLKVLIPILGELSPEEIKDALAELLNQKRKSKQASQNSSQQNSDEEDEDTTSPQGLLNSWTNQPLQNTSKTFNNNTLSSGVIPSAPTSKDFWNNENNGGYTENPGGFVGQAVIGMQYQKDQGERIKKQFERELEVDLRRNQLIELAGSFEPYSFGWFKTLLELEDSFTAEDRVKKNPLKILFNKAELGDDGIMVLSETSLIPSNIEEIGDLSIQVFQSDDKITVEGELIGIRKKSLQIRLKNDNQFKALKMSEINRAIVEASSPDFILERLKNGFSRLNFDNADNLKSKHHLPENLNFIFGPPGTGKTTYISWLIGGKNPQTLDFCEEEIKPFMDSENCRVLVLTPTNKAADVVAERIINNYEQENDYPSWLVRFGQTQSLEKSTSFIGDRKLNISLEQKLTLVTTIARFPYDSFNFLDGDKIISKTALKDFNWDVIIFDEASMIGQASLLYVIFYAKQINPKVKFFIGGDPFQIPPIIQFEYPFWSYIPDPAFDDNKQPILDENGNQMAWKQDGGNIYSFTELMADDSFINPRTSPHPFKVHNLNKQYRSIEAIGKLFSKYRYSDALSHNRTEDEIKLDPKIAPLQIEIENLPLKALNIIRFPVNKYGGVYRSRSVKGSPYHIYSAIFTVELIKYIQANAQLSAEKYKIGIISPYAIQSGLISKLIESVGEGKIEIVVGTVHGFQGDECNLMIVVLNPPRKISRSVRSFINKKNILNVAISRARDKMIILSPYDPDNELNLDDLHQIRYIERLCGKLDPLKKELLGYEASEIEEKLWGNAHYIEEVTLAAPHQNVNIYAQAIKHYEIRHDENAVDVLIKR